ncbi:MAG: MerR family transcriptional regulator, partial [Propioniciclava sp.]
MEWMQIGEVARRTGLTTRTLRHYDALGLLVPSGRSGGDYRQYTLEDVRRLLAIQHLKSLGLGLTEIGAALRNGLDPQTTLREHIDAVEERISAEQALLARLRGLLAASHDDWDDVLTAIELSERVRHPDGGVRF